MLKKTLVALAQGGALMGAGQAMAADYAIDKQGQHAFVERSATWATAGCTVRSRTSTAASASTPPSRRDSKVNVTLNTTSVDTTMLSVTSAYPQ